MARTSEWAHTHFVTTEQVIRTATAIERIGDEARTVVDLCRGVHDAIASLVPSDRWCGFAVDPATLFPTNGYHDEGIPYEFFPRLLELEHGTDDVNHLSALARSTCGVATIDEATNGDPASSARWRDVLEPAGLQQELRAVLRERPRDGGRAWGALILLRAGDSLRFTAAETDVVAHLTPSIATAFRRTLVRQHLDHADDAREAGILVVGGDPLEVLTATDAARSWLGQLDDGGSGMALPTCVSSAVHASRLQPDGPAAVRARTRSGRWVTITAERMATPAGGDRGDTFGVIVQPSRPAEIASIVGAAHRLTPRESDVVVLVAAGRSNREIARALDVSPHTVSDHLKSIFAKLEVASRGEMTSKLFHDHYLPREMGGRPAGTDGWYLPE